MFLREVNRGWSFCVQELNCRVNLFFLSPWQWMRWRVMRTRIYPFTWGGPRAPPSQGSKFRFDPSFDPNLIQFRSLPAAELCLLEPRALVQARPPPRKRTRPPRPKPAKTKPHPNQCQKYYFAKDTLIIRNPCTGMGSNFLYRLTFPSGRIDTGAWWIVLWITHSDVCEHMVKHYAYALCQFIDRGTFNPSVPDAPNWRISVFEERLHETETW